MSSNIKLYNTRLTIQSYQATLLATLRDLVRSLLRPLANRAFGFLSFAIPLRPGDTYVSPVWMTRVLRNGGWISNDVVVTRADLTSVSGNRGLTGTTYRLVMTYSKENAGPKSFIVKLSHSGRSGRRSILASGQYREAHFYNSSYAAQLTPGMLPRTVYSHGSGLLGEFVVIIEDVTLTSVAPVNFVFGNQIWGIKEPLNPAHDPLVVLEAMYLRAAEQHARNWNNRQLLRHGWLKGAQWYHGRGQAEWQLAIARGAAAWAVAKKGAAASQFSPKLVSIVDKSFENASWDALQARLHDPKIPFTLCHGDFHAANMFVRNNADSAANNTEAMSIVMFDWSEVGPWEPTTDLVQTLISDVKPHLTAGHSQSLVRKYWAHLIKHGVSAEDYPFETCWKSFCEAGPSRWIWVFAILASFPGMPAVAVKYFHDQLLSFIETHGDLPFYQLGPVVILV